MPETTEQRPARLIACMPRILRANAAPAYLGMCRTEFNKTVRPYVREFRIGVQGIGFDREELDAWADAYIDQASIEKEGATGHDHSRSERQGEKPWRKKPLAASTKGTGSGTSTRSSEVSEFRKALDQATGRRRSNT
ncbi:hypothetical protein [Pseudomonas indica]|uniref:hypothetical protein n=1 Tax=Pseudomonas indica TaxID=137658 RepID=UPI0020D12D29|nr:hypothetical protein [Pseudomonas indica]